MTDDSEHRKPTAVPDERLRLIFTCCHPALNREAQIALSLRTLCGLTTEEIARAFLTPATTMAQRIVRAQRKIRSRDSLRGAVGRCVSGAARIRDRGHLPGFQRRVLGERRRRNGAQRSMRRSDPPRPNPWRPDAARAEPRGLLALMLLQDSRRDTRMDATAI